MAKNTFILSDESKNSYGFIVDTATLKLSRFQSNPVMLYLHDQLKHIGKWDNVRIEGKQLMAEPDFDLEDEAGKEINRKVEKGFLKGASIGLNIGNVVKDKDGTPRALNCEVIEASVVPIPSNGSALKVYDQNGRQLDHQQVTTLLAGFIETQQKPEIDMKLSAKTLELLGLDANATEEQINAALETKLAAQPTPPPTPPADGDNKELKALQDDVKAFRTERNEGIVDLAIEQGKFLPAQRETYLNALNTDFAKTKKEIEELPVRKKLGANVKPGAASEDEVSFDKLRKEDPQALLKMKAEDPEKYKELMSKSSAAKYL